MTTVWDNNTNDFNDLVNTGDGMAFATHYPSGRATSPPFRSITYNGVGGPTNPFAVGDTEQATDFIRYGGLWLRPWVNDPTRAVWDEETQLWYAWVITNNNKDFIGGTWGEIVSPDLVNWVGNGYRFYTDNNDMGSNLWGGSVVIDNNNTAGFGAGAALYFITMPGGVAESSQQCTTRWVAPALGCPPVYDKIVQVNNGPSSDPNNPIHAPGMDFRDTRVDWDDDHNQWVLKITVGYGVAFYASQDTETWTFLSVIDLSAWQQIETPDMVPMVADDGTKKWVLFFSLKTWEGQSRQLIGYMVGGWDGKTFTPDSPTPLLFCEGPDFYANAIFQKDGVTYGWGWMMNWAYAGSGASSGYANTTSTVLQLGLKYRTDLGSYKLTYAPLREHYKMYPWQTDYWTNTLNTTGDSWNCPLSTVGNTFQYHCFIHTRVTTGSDTTEITIDTGIQGNNYTRLVLRPTAGTYTFSRSNSGSEFYGYGDMVTAFNADVNGPLDNAPIYYVIFLWDSNGVEIIINNTKYICANVFLPDGPKGLRITNTGTRQIFIDRVRLRC